MGLASAGVVLAGALALGGCGVDAGGAGGVGGGAVENWAGTYAGFASQSGRCADGSTIPGTSQPATLTITQTGGSLRWTADCGAVASANASGTTATVLPYSCPPRTMGAQTTQLSVTGGTLTLQGTSLVLSLTQQITLSGAVTGFCDVTLTGTLTRQQ